VTIICEPDQPYAVLLAADIGGDARIVSNLRAAVTGVADGTVVVLGPGLELEPVLTFVARLLDRLPDVRVVLLRHDPSRRAIARAFSAGIREVVPASDVAAVVDAVRRVTPSAAGEASRHRPAGRIVTVFSAKGGCGKTTLATNLAAVLHAGGARRVCLVDLDLVFGDVASTLDLEPERSLVDALGRLDADRIADLVTSFRPGLDCILAPAGAGEGARVPPGLVGDLLALLPAVYDYVVVDTPAQFSANVLTALDAAHHQVLLTTPERPALKNLRLTLDMLDLLSYPRETRAIVVNRADSRIGLTAPEVEDLVRSPIAGQLPSRWDVPASIDRGVPLVMTDPDHVVSLAIRRLAAEHIAPALPPPVVQTEPATSDHSWRWW
jgi:pilus assembly protein CpaE